MRQPGRLARLVVHGGPGSGSTPRARQYFDPDRYRVLPFDQRGCGRSTPHASDPATDMSHNTTAHLVADMERLREHLGIDKWLLYGGSWGSTLILAYSEEHPERVTEAVIPAVTTTRRSEIDWLYRGVGHLFPEAWDTFRAGVLHLAEEFERRLAELRETGVIPDPRAAQIERLKEQVSKLKKRLAERDSQIDGLTDFRERALSQIAAQRMEIERLRDVLAEPLSVAPVLGNG